MRGGDSEACLSFPSSVIDVDQSEGHLRFLGSWVIGHVDRGRNKGSGLRTSEGGHGPENEAWFSG